MWKLRPIALLVILLSDMICDAADFRTYSHRTIKNSHGCLSIEEKAQRILFEKNPSGFNGIWNVRETKEGWLICREIDQTKPDVKPAYLSYALKSEKEVAGDKPREQVFLSVTAEENSYWKFDITSRRSVDFDCHLQPMHGEFDGAYLTFGEELSDKKSPIWKQKSAVVLVREKPSSPIQFRVDGR